MSNETEKLATAECSNCQRRLQQMPQSFAAKDPVSGDRRVSAQPWREKRDDGHPVQLAARKKY
jgi:hypothetical protein